MAGFYNIKSITIKKLVILGASYIQRPLIQRAKELGYQTHVFAWEQGAVAKSIADFFYAISIRDREQLFKECLKIHPHGIVSIGSDLAMPSVNYIADKLALVGNTLECSELTTNKYAMRRRLHEAGLPCPHFKLIKEISKFRYDFRYPVIVKPTDRSGSRGVCKVSNEKELATGLRRALDESFKKEVILEEYIEGREISIEMLSWEGNHEFLSLTDKLTTGSPYFVETEHHQPAHISEEMKTRVISLTRKALDSLMVKYGASHTEIIITKDDEIYFVEIGARMGGDHIGAKLIELSTGNDFMKNVIDVAVGNVPIVKKLFQKYSGIYYACPQKGFVSKIYDYTTAFKEIIEKDIFVKIGDYVQFPLYDSSCRPAYFIYRTSDGKCTFSPNNIIKIITQPSNGGIPFC